MTVIDRAHRIVLILMMTTIPAVVLVKVAIEVIRHDVLFPPGLQVFVVLVAVSAYQVATRQWQADWVIGGGGLAIATLGVLSYYGTATVVDLNSASVIVPTLGLISIAIGKQARFASGIALGVVTEYLVILSGIADGLRLDDLVQKALAIAVLFGFGGWILYQLRRDYEEQYASRDRFVATVSHELRTPLTALAGFAAALQDGTVDVATPEGAEVLALISGEAREAADIVDDLLVAFRSASGELSIDAEETDLSDAASKVIAAMAAGGAVGGKEITQATPSVLVLADSLRLRQIVRNLLTNAIRHGGAQIDVRIRRDDETGYVVVADNGSGFDPDEVDTLFEPYGRSRHTDTRNGSIGLGLTVSRQLARRMGGDLTADRVDGLTVFQLSLPVAPTPEPSRTP
jgi:signal transduction histidine kinase